MFFVYNYYRIESYILWHIHCNDFTCKFIFPCGTVSNSILSMTVVVSVWTLNSGWYVPSNSVVLRHSRAIVVRLVRFVFVLIILNSPLTLSFSVDQFSVNKGFDRLSSSSFISMPTTKCSDWVSTLIIQSPNYVLPDGHPRHGLSIHLGASGGELEQET